jgi:alpha/beta superfamily hydrolase
MGLASGQEHSDLAAGFKFSINWPHEKRHGGMINQMVSSLFRYVPGRGYASFPAHSHAVGRSLNSLLSSTEV